MKTFTVQLFQSIGTETLPEVALFVGEDCSGSFGIQAGHAGFMTALNTGLARVLFDQGRTEYLALPGGLLYFRDNILVLHTRRYWRGDDPAQMHSILQASVESESQSLRHIKSNLKQIEDNMMRRLLELERHG